MTATIELHDIDTDIDHGGAERDADLAWFLSASGAGDRTGDRRPLNDDRLAAIVATGLSGLPIASVPEGVDRALALVGHQRGVQRAFYYRLDAGAGELELTHEWSCVGIVDMKTRGDYVRVPASVVTPELLAMLGRGGVLRLPRTRGLLGGPIDDIVSPGGDRALAVVPVNVAGTLLGLAGFSAAIGSTWDERHFDFLRIVAQGIGRAIERKRIEEERAELSVRADAARAEAEAARAELTRILSRISDGFAAFDREGNITFANDRALAIMGRSREQLIGRRVWTEFPEMIGSPTHRAFLRAAGAQETTIFEELSTRTGRWHEVRMYPSPSGVSVFFEDITDRKRALEQLKSDREYLRQELSGIDPCEAIIGLSSAIKQVLERARLVAVTNTSVLITGETGTGKELVARAIHEMSPRRERLLVKVNCAAISAGLVESELFGHEKGAFTGALARRKGRFELAHGGTLFLDEVGELPLEMQAKLLRVLQEREFERVGGSETVRVDVRVVAATNRNLTELVEAGRFREDLLYRLNVFPLQVPPLRQRAQDIPLLVHAFVRRFGPPSGKRIDGLSPEAMQRLSAYGWPGNVRELQNVMERAVILSTGPLLEPSAFPELCESPTAGWDEPTPTPTPGPGAGTVDEIARAYVQAILQETDWVIEGQRGAARRLGLHPNTLRSRLKRWGLSRPAAATPLPAPELGR
jgi:formate hydrogenlyase transcriptional activator